jgi:hypothetical protein
MRFQRSRGGVHHRQTPRPTARSTNQLGHTAREYGKHRVEGNLDAQRPRDPQPANAVLRS